MVRKSILIIACTAMLAGCGDNGLPRPGQDRAYQLRSYAPNNAVTADLRPAVPAPAITTEPEQQFSYTHSWAVLMAQDTVSPRFVRARDLCLRDKALDCRLVSASQTTDASDGSVSAALEVQLPHQELDVFEHALLAPLNGEKAGDAAIQSRSTQAQSVETEANDTARKVAQLAAYRDRLAEIAKRSNLSIDDIIKLEAERARVETDLDDATGQQRQLANGIAREDVSITLNERVAEAGPFAQFGRDAADTLSRSTANALIFAIGVLPWLPLAALLVWLVSLFWRWLITRRVIKVLARREVPPAAEL